MDLGTLTVRQRDMIVHASGLSQSKDLYRDHYADSATNPDLLRLVELGLMSGPFTRPSFSPDAFFYLTDAGKDAARRFTGKLKARETADDHP